MRSERNRRKTARHTINGAAWMIRAIPKRVISDDDVDVMDLGALAALRDVLDNAIADTAHNLQTSGYSWSDIGRALGVTKQEAHRRYGRKRQPNDNQEAAAA